MKKPPPSKVQILLFVSSGLVLSTAGVVVLPRLSPEHAQIANWITTGLTPVAIGVLAWMFLRTRAYAREHDGQICHKCRYPLKGLPAPSRCPECGNPYGEDRDARFWAHFL